MKKPVFRSVLAVLACLAAAPVSAKLPAFDEHPWLGYFVGFESRRFHFGVTAEATGTLMPIGAREKPVGQRICPGVDFVIEELVPGRDPVRKTIDIASLETSDAPVSKPGKATFRGKVTGGASFEIVMEFLRDDVSIGGRILDPGTLKNPLRFSVRVRVPDVYHEVDKETKNFEKNSRRDRVTVVGSNGKNLKIDPAEVTDARSPEINGDGIRSVEFEFYPHNNHTFALTASPNSSIRLWNNVPGPLRDGFHITWHPDPAKDPDGKARLTISAK